MEDTSGFYKSNSGSLLYGPNFVLNAEYELRRGTREQYNYPLDGWSWFDTEEEAREFFNIPKEVPVPLEGTSHDTINAL